MADADSLVHSDEPLRVIRARIKEFGQERVLIQMFDGQPYATARDWSQLYADCFGMTSAEFMRCWRKLRFAASQERAKAASSEAAARVRSSSDSGSK